VDNKHQEKLDLKMNCHFLLRLTSLLLDKRNSHHMLLIFQERIHKNQNAKDQIPHREVYLLLQFHNSSANNKKRHCHQGIEMYNQNIRELQIQT
jgi:hypothetical protein